MNKKIKKNIALNLVGLTLINMSASSRAMFHGPISMGSFTLNRLLPPLEACSLFRDLTPDLEQQEQQRHVDAMIQKVRDFQESGYSPAKWFSTRYPNDEYIMHHDFFVNLSNYLSCEKICQYLIVLIRHLNPYQSSHIVSWAPCYAAESVDFCFYILYQLYCKNSVLRAGSNISNFEAFINDLPNECRPEGFRDAQQFSLYSYLSDSFDKCTSDNRNSFSALKTKKKWDKKWPHSGTITFDTHGLSLDSLYINVMQLYLMASKENEIETINYISGQGEHSTCQGLPVSTLYVIKFLTQQRIKFVIPPDNPGMVRALIHRAY